MGLRGGEEEGDEHKILREGGMRLKGNSCPAVNPSLRQAGYASAVGNGESGETTKQKKTGVGESSPAGVYLMFFRMNAEIIQLESGPTFAKLG